MNKTFLFEVKADDDYFASSLMDHATVTPIGAAKEMYKSGFMNVWVDVELYVDGGPVTGSYRLREFNTSVPKWFVDFIRNEVQDSDNVKHSDFFIFNIEELKDTGDIEGMIETGSK